MALIRIDPVHPVVWRSTTALQVGGDPALVVFDPIERHEERMLAALRAGIPEAGLAAVGGCSEEQARAFLRRIRPALAGSTIAPARIALRISSVARDDIVRTARMLGLVTSASRGRPEIGVVVADHVVPPRAYRDWVRDGVPHFAVVLGTHAVDIGPLVIPGATGCLRCADLRRCDTDPAWPAVAAQLLAQPAGAALAPILWTEALCAAARLATELARGGRPRARMIDPHPDCGCALDLQLPLAG